MLAGHPTRLLLSCRDANAAQQILPLARAALDSGRYEVNVVADSPALDMLRAHGLFAIGAGIQPVNRTDLSGRILAQAKAAALLRDFAPEALIASSSGPDGCVDEALVSMA